jgi:hypothetical protein
MGEKRLSPLGSLADGDPENRKWNSGIRKRDVDADEISLLQSIHRRCALSTPRDGDRIASAWLFEN